MVYPGKKRKQSLVRKQISRIIYGDFRQIYLADEDIRIFIPVSSSIKRIKSGLPQKREDPAAGFPDGLEIFRRIGISLRFLRNPFLSTCHPS